MGWFDFGFGLSSEEFADLEERMVSVHRRAGHIYSLSSEQVACSLDVAVKKVRSVHEASGKFGSMGNGRFVLRGF